MQLTGQSIIGTRRAASSEGAFFAVNPGTGKQLEPVYYSASDGDLDEAASQAAAAFLPYRALSRGRRGEFLREIAAQLESLGDPLVERVILETALPETRVRAEWARTANQLRFFAGIVEEGSWVDARIDSADPGRKPPKPDVRSMLRPLGPVAVFCASNFPLAFSTAGGDVASALAAGNPVVVNAHFSHPGTAEMCGTAIAAAAHNTGMPGGVFSLLFSQGHHIGQALVAHPLIKAVGFTGSRRGGLALAETARSRAEPVPFYAEMSSVNPVFVLPNAAALRGAVIAAGLHTSIISGVGQFCTNPGVALLAEGPVGNALAAELGARIEATAAAPMLNPGILANYGRLVDERAHDARLRRVAQGLSGSGAVAALFEVDAQTFLDSPALADEVFGPASLMVRYRTLDQALEVAQTMEGNLTATIHMAEGDEDAAGKLTAALETRVGRIVFQGYPTGLEVCQAMVHGGAWPATSDGRTTSVGGRAIDRFARPVCFQDAPESLLPEELRSGNPAGIWRLRNGERAKD